MNRIFGTGVALITPFNEDGSIDYLSFEKLLSKVIKGGVDFLVVLGTTGEATSISKKEKIELINYVVKFNNNKLPLVSIDFNHSSYSSVFDESLTRASDDKLYKICAWYDNEWGFSNRMLDVTMHWVN